MSARPPLLAGALAAVLLVAAPVSAETIPPAALRAEMEQRFDDALGIYAEALAQSPERADLWLRVADIHAVRKQAGPAADALGRAAQIRAGDAELQARWSQALAMADRPQDALLAIRNATRLVPHDTTYLEAQAQLAAWNGDLVLAELSYRTWMQLAPQDCRPPRGLALLLSQRGDLDAAADLHERCLRVPALDSDARLHLAAVHAYRGNFQAAREQLGWYHRVAGATPEYRRALADLEARSGRPGRALALVEPMVAEHPQDYDLQLVRTLALHQHREPAAALAGLDTLGRLGPARPETRGMRLQVKTPQRATLAASGTHYADSGGLEQRRLGLSGGLQAGPAWRWTLEAAQVDTRAEAGSGLEAGDGRTQIDVEQLSLGMRAQITPWLQLEAAAGTAKPEQGESSTTYLGALRLWPADTASLRLALEQDLLLVSPRAIALGIERERARAQLGAQVGDRWFLAAELNLDRYNDGNRSRDGLLAPRFAVARTERYNLDLGLRAYWLQHDSDTGSGYYSPDDFERYWATLGAYGKLSEDSGVGLGLAYGVERDAVLDAGFRRGGEATVEGTFGVFRDWQLRVWGAAGGRLDTVAFQSGSYHGRSLGMEILRRF